MTRYNVTFRMARASDAVAFYGTLPAERIRAVVGIQDGDPVMIGGIYYADGWPIVFSSLKDCARKNKRAIALCARMVMKMVNEVRPALAVVNKNESTAPGFLAGLGFRPTGITSEAGEFLIYRGENG